MSHLIIVGVFRRHLREVRSESLRDYRRIQHGDMTGMDAKRLMALEVENTKLNQLLAGSLRVNERTREALRGAMFPSVPLLQRGECRTTRARRDE